MSNTPAPAGVMNENIQAGMPKNMVPDLGIMIQCSKCLSKELTLVLSDIRELNRVPNTK